MASLFSTDGVRAAINYFDDALVRYGRARSAVTAQVAAVGGVSTDGKYTTKRYVGQFVDSEGIQSTQHGVYGMSAWLALCGSLDPEIVALRDSCRSALGQWITESAEPGVENDPNCEAYELKYVIPKICFAYRAMMATQNEEAARIMLSRVKDAGPHGSWGPLSNSGRNERNPWTTALVVRTFKSAPGFEPLLKSALNYLYHHHKILENPCLRLYVLNTIAIADPIHELVAGVTAKDLKEAITKGVRDVRSTLVRDPLSLSNPITLHFSDDRGGRIRYYRFPGDLIVLESLLMISNPIAKYYDSHIGARIGERLSSILAGPHELALDTCGDRTSFPTCLYIRDLLETIRNRGTEAQNILSRLFGRLISMVTFQRRITSHIALCCAFGCAYWLLDKFGHWKAAPLEAIGAAAILEVLTALWEIYYLEYERRRS